MRPIEIEILIHYYTRADDYREGDFSAPAIREIIDSFSAGPDSLIERSTHRGQCYTVSDRGRVYVEALMAVPLPVRAWVIPKSAERQL